MTYSSGGLIQAADYNTFVQGGATVNHNIANLNSIWGVGFGDKGYGQTGLLPTVDTTNTVTATQWATLIARLNTIQTHQTGNNTGLAAPVAGGTVAFSTALQNFVSTVYTNRAVTGIQGTDSAVNTTTHSWVSATPTTFQIVRVFTFPDAESARYFFNAGGLLSLAFNATDGLPNLKGANWAAFLNNKITSFLIAGKSSGRTGFGASVTTEQPAIGYWGLTTTDQTLFAAASGTGTSYYDSNTISIKARTNGVQGANGDNGTIITVTIDLNDIAIDTGTGRNLSLSIGVNSTARRPETTALPTAIAYPALIPVTYAITPSVTSLSEGGTISFTVSAPASPNGAVFKVRLDPTSTLTDNDFVNGSFSATVTINNGTASFSVALANDAITEGTETFRAQLFTGGAPDPTPVTVLATSSTITVADTSTGAFVFSPTISTTTTNYNLRSAAVAAGWNQIAPLNATVTVANGVIVGATNTSNYAFDTGVGFPAGTTLRLNIGTGAYVVGAGGAGGASVTASNGNSGSAGGPALRAQAPITIANSGTIGAGGGGGGAGSAGPTYSAYYSGSTQTCTGAGGGGGGGAGFVVGAGGAASANASSNAPTANTSAATAGTAGTTTAGGAGGTAGYIQTSASYINTQVSYGGNGGNGGALGAAGASGAVGPGSNLSAGGGGAVGIAVTGSANITWSPMGTIAGPTDSFVFSPTISSNTSNYNLKAAAIAAGWNQTVPLNATVSIAAGVVVGAASTGAYAFDTGTGFPAGTTLRLNIGTGAFVVGQGGDGGSPNFGVEYSVAGTTGGNGANGGPALRAQAPITIANSGTIGSGGGGGGAGGSTQNQPGGSVFRGGVGGKGAGPGAAQAGAAGENNNGDRGGGTGGSGGAFGASGGAGTSAYNGQGGAAIGLGGSGGTTSLAVTGTSNVTWSPMGTIAGPTDAFVFSPTISGTTTNYNLRAAAVAAGWNQVVPLIANVSVAAGAVVGATSIGAYAFDTGTGFPASSSLALTIASGAYIVGAGGAGGAGGNGLNAGSPGSNPGANGANGGPALRAQAAISITNNGTIGGGGGAGGGGGSGTSTAGGSGVPGMPGSGGGGGAGYIVGAGGAGGGASETVGTNGAAGSSGTTTSGGAGGPQVNQIYTPGGAGGNGGGLGSSGTAGANGPGGAAGGAAGAAGAAVVGTANITWGITGTRLGAIS